MCLCPNIYVPDCILILCFVQLRYEARWDNCFVILGCINETELTCNIFVFLSKQVAWTDCGPSYICLICLYDFQMPESPMIICSNNNKRTQISWEHMPSRGMRTTAYIAHQMNRFEMRSTKQKRYNRRISELNSWFYRKFVGGTKKAFGSRGSPETS